MPGSCGFGVFGVCMFMICVDVTRSGSWILKVCEHDGCKKEAFQNLPERVFSRLASR